MDAWDERLGLNTTNPEEYKRLVRLKEEHPTASRAWIDLKFDKGDFIKELIKETLGAGLLGLMFGAFLVEIIIVIFTGMVEDELKPYLGISPFVTLGLITAIISMVVGGFLEFFSWPLYVWWDKKISSLSPNIRWAFQLNTVFKGILLALIVGTILSLVICGVLFNSINGSEQRTSTICCWIAVYVIYLLIKSPKRKGSKAGNVRSEWEENIYTYVDNVFPNLNIEANNRSIIRSREGNSNYYEIDIWIPELKLGFELNGERYHDHSGYLRDLKNGTEYTRERYKEKYCADRGLKLVHIWSSMDSEEIKRKINNEIRARYLY